MLLVCFIFRFFFQFLFHSVELHDALRRFLHDKHVPQTKLLCNTNDWNDCDAYLLLYIFVAYDCEQQKKKITHTKKSDLNSFHINDFDISLHACIQSLYVRIFFPFNNLSSFRFHLNRKSNYAFSWNYPKLIFDPYLFSIPVTNPFRRRFILHSNAIMKSKMVYRLSNENVEWRIKSKLSIFSIKGFQSKLKDQKAFSLFICTNISLKFMRNLHNTRTSNEFGNKSFTFKIQNAHEWWLNRKIPFSFVLNESTNQNLYVFNFKRSSLLSTEEQKKKDIESNLTTEKTKFFTLNGGCFEMRKKEEY